MKIVAPVSSVSEVDMLLHFGADELYCGVTTPEWDHHFGNHVWMNRRSPSQANLTSRNDLQEVVRLAHERNVPVHLTLNGPFYTEGSIRYLLRLCEKLAVELNVDSVIVSDLNVLIRLFQEELPLRIHLSSLGGCFNSRTADFYQSLGVKRIILPRQLRLSEIRSIVTRRHSGMEFEVFAINDGCLFEEGFCRTTHSLGPFCLTSWKVKAHETGGNNALLRQMEERLEDLRTYLWFQNNCGSSFQSEGLPNGPCSLCGFGHFRDWGVHAVKIVGREASFHRKMASLQLIKAVMAEVKENASPDGVARFARSLRNTPDYCDKGYMCYFRDCEER